MRPFLRKRSSINFALPFILRRCGCFGEVAGLGLGFEAEEELDEEGEEEEEEEEEDVEALAASEQGDEEEEATEAVSIFICSIISISICSSRAFFSSADGDWALAKSISSMSSSFCGVSAAVVSWLWLVWFERRFSKRLFSRSSRDCGCCCCWGLAS